MATATNNLELLPTDLFVLKEENLQGHILLLTLLVNSLIQGRGNNTGTFTLTADTATTNIGDNLFESQQVPLLIPRTANAAFEIANGSCYVSTKTSDQFTVAHANNNQTDRIFDYIFVG